MMVLAVGFSLGGQPAPAAAATTHHPKGAYERFSDCPLTAPVLEDCVFATINGGSVTVGRRVLPIDKPIVLQGGFYEGPAEEFLVFVGAEDGNTLSSAQLSVPGGLTGLIPRAYVPASQQGQLARSSAGVTVTLQLARSASAIRLSTENLLERRGIALQLPVKIKLNNQFLGENCYVGSSLNPVVLSLTTGATSPGPPNRPIEGTVGALEFSDGFQLLSLSGSELVDNSFAAPQATGCGGSSATAVDSALDAAMGLPSASGHNTAILDGTFYLAMPSAVRSSE
jgi:hypothetical protein